MRLSPQDRLRKRFEFGRARDQGRRVHTHSFVLLIRQNELARSRIGLTVSQKVGGAVRRNRVKRLLREVFRQHRELFPEASDIVVIAKASCAADSFDQVCGELRKAASAMRAARAAAKQSGTKPARSAR